MAAVAPPEVALDDLAVTLVQRRVESGEALEHRRHPGEAPRAAAVGDDHRGAPTVVRMRPTLGVSPAHQAVDDTDDAADVTPSSLARSTGPTGPRMRWRRECSSDVLSPACRATTAGTVSDTSTSSCRPTTCRSSATRHAGDEPDPGQAVTDVGELGVDGRAPGDAHRGTRWCRRLVLAVNITHQLVIY